MTITYTGVRRATLDDIPYICDLNNKFTRELGFIPKIALERRIEGSAAGYVALATENDEPAGFLHTGSLAKSEARIFQAAIQYDAQRRHLGQALVEDFLSTASESGVKLVTLRCLSDLDANSFWRSMGFKDVAREVVTSDKNRGRLLVVWAKRMHTMSDLLTPGWIPPAIPLRTHRCRECNKKCTYTRGPKGELWKLCRQCALARMAIR